MGSFLVSAVSLCGSEVLCLTISWFQGWNVLTLLLSSPPTNQTPLRQTLYAAFNLLFFAPTAEQSCNYLRPRLATQQPRLATRRLCCVCVVTSSQTRCKDWEDHRTLQRVAEANVWKAWNPCKKILWSHYMKLWRLNICITGEFRTLGVSKQCDVCQGRLQT